MSEYQVEQLQHSIKAAQVRVDLAQSLERLRKNRDFHAVITQGYLIDEALRLVYLKAEPAMQTPMNQASIEKQIDALGGFNSFLTTIEFLGRQAARTIEADNETLDWIRQNPNGEEQ